MIDEIKLEIYKEVKNRIEITSCSKKRKDIYNKNKNRVHFMPMNFKILNGILQSLNIQFGPLVEHLIKELVIKSNIYKVYKMPGNKIKWNVSKNQANKIAEYLDDKKTKTNKINLNKIINEKYINDDNITKSSKKIDIDMLLKKDKEYHIFEIKTSDDHDTGKIESIAKKLLETYFSLKNKFDRENIEYSKINFYVYYFNKNIKFKNSYLKEDEIVLRGDSFFEKFTIFKYSDIQEIFDMISKDKEIIQKFENLYQDIIIHN